MIQLFESTCVGVLLRCDV